MNAWIKITNQRINGREESIKKLRVSLLKMLIDVTALVENIAGIFGGTKDLQQQIF